jgi:hypothetical protein
VRRNQVASSDMSRALGTSSPATAGQKRRILITIALNAEMRLLEAAPNEPWLLQARAAAAGGAASGKPGDYAKLISLLRSRADRRGECSVMTIPDERAGSIPKPRPFEAAHCHLSLCGRTGRGARGTPISFTDGRHALGLPVT